MHVVLSFTPLFRNSVDHVLQRLKVRARSTSLRGRFARSANRDSCSRDRNLTPVYMAQKAVRCSDPLELIGVSRLDPIGTC